MWALHSRVTYSAKVRRKALKLAGSGLAIGDAAARAGVGERQLRRWLAAARPTPKTSRPAPQTPEASAGELCAADMARAATDEAIRLSDAALADEDRTAASRAVRALQKAASIEERLAGADSEDGLAMTATEWEAVKAKVMRELADRLATAAPLPCASCGREIHALPLPVPEVVAELALTRSKLDVVAPRTRQAFARAKQIAEVSASVGNHRAGVRSVVDMVDAAATTARAERRTRKRDGLAVMSRIECDRRERQLSDNLAALVADRERLGGTCCGQCAREIRMYLASNGTLGRPPIPSQGDFTGRQRTGRA
jgi:hypothetical protein